jgi:hypothetical protein
MEMSIIHMNNTAASIHKISLRGAEKYYVTISILNK